jgi:hypothetical protein
MTDQTKNAKDMTPQEFAAAKRDVTLNARRAAREPKPDSFSRSDRNLQEAKSNLGDFSAHDLKREELTDVKRKFSQLGNVNDQGARQARTLARIKARQDSRSKA